MRPSMAFFKSSDVSARERLTAAWTVASTFLLLCSASRARVAIRSWLRFCSVMSRAIFDAPTNLALRILNRRDGQRDDDKAAVLALANGLKMVDTLPAPDARQDITLFVLSIFGNNNGDGLTDRLCGSVAEHTFDALVPARDNAVEVLAYDHVIARLHDGRQPTQPLFCFP